MGQIPPADGLATISPDNPVPAGSVGSWAITYTVGEDEIQPGGVLRLTVPPGFSPPQIHHPGAPGFVTASCLAARVTITLTVGEDEEGNPGPGGLLGYDVDIFVESAPVNRREKITIVYGDQSGGSLGAFVAQSAGEVAFGVSLQTGRGDWTFRPLKRSPTLRVVRADIIRLSVVVPSTVEVERTFPVHVLGVDRFGNAEDLSGNQGLGLTTDRGDLKWPSNFALRQQDGTAQVTARSPGGPFRVRAREQASGMEAVSNPIFASGRLNEVLLWGDLHGHSTLSDGSVHPHSYFAHGRDIARLDFAAISDHLPDSSSPGAAWQEAIRAPARAFDATGRFIPLAGFESLDTMGGHQNVYFRDLLPPDSDSAGSLSAREGEVPFREEALVVPHAHGRTSWNARDLRSVRLAEVYSCWGGAERWGASRSSTHPSRHPGGTIQAALAFGLRTGLVAGSDSHTGFPGDAIRVRTQPRHPSGLTAVYADSFTRPALWAGLKRRSCYATTGARIVLRFEVEHFPMGSEVDIGGPDDPLIRGRAVSVKVYGTSRVSRIDIVRNNADICSYRGDNDVVQFRWVDGQDLTRISIPRPACKHPLTYYYVRVLQEDGEMAWSSPIWLTLTYLP